MGLITASIIAFGFFVAMPMFWTWAWPKMLKVRDEHGWENWKFMVALTTLWHAFWVLIANLCMWGVYHLELPLFEKYKVTS